MKVLLVQGSQPFTFIPTLLEKKSFPLLASLTYQENNVVGKRLKHVQDVFPNKEWILTAEFHFYDPESPKLDIKLEGELLKILHDAFYFGSNNERLQIGLTASVSYKHYDPGYGTRSSQTTITAKDMEVDNDEQIEKHFRYIQKDVLLPELWLRGETFYSTMTNVYWRISVELTVNDVVDLTGLLPKASDKIARILEEKLFCGFEIISSDGVKIPCHKAILCVSSAKFMTKCQSKLKERSKNQMTMDISEDSVNAFLAFIYCGQIQKPLTDCSIALELFKAGDQCLISDLERVMAAIFLQKSHHWYDIDVALQLFQFLVNYKGELSSKLKEKVINVLAMKSDELQGCESFGELFKTPVERQMFELMAAAVKTRTGESNL